MQISQWRAARIICLFSSFFKNTISSSCTRNFNFMRPALQFFLGKNTNFCYIIHLKIISVSSTPFAKNHLVTFACINFVLLKTLMALISIACAIVQCFNKQCSDWSYGEWLPSLTHSESWKSWKTVHDAAPRSHSRVYCSDGICTFLSLYTSLRGWLGGVLGAPLELSEKAKQ